jgi:AcrR family transcriptional regulator
MSRLHVIEVPKAIYNAAGLTDPMTSPKRAQRRYHHGDLRAALLSAAELELAEHGIEGLTLRGCARRAGVSHAAPAHHFKDGTELLSEMAATAFEGLTEITRGAGQSAVPGSLDHLVAVACAYVRFAIRHPHHFRLMFRSERLDFGHERLKQASEAAFQVPVDAIGAYYGSADAMADPELARQVIAIWAIAHGLSDLLISTRRLRAIGGGDLDKALESLVPPIVRQHFAQPGRPCSEK